MIYIGGIPQSAKEILSEYIEKFFPDEQIEDITDKAGIKGLLRTFGGKPQVKLIIIGKGLYDMCYSSATEVLSMGKTHKYLNDGDLTSYLIDNFGDIHAPEPSQVDSDNEVSDEGDMSEASLMVSQDDYDDLESQLQVANAQVYEKDERIKVLEAKLERMAKVRLDEPVVTVVQPQTHTISNPELESKCHALEVELKAQQDIAAGLNNELFTLKGKAAKYDILVKDLDTANSKIGELQKELESAETNKSELKSQISTLTLKIDSLETSVIEFENLKTEYATLQSEKEALEGKLATTNTEIESLQTEISTLKAEVDKLKQELANKGVLTKRLATVENELEEALQKIKTCNAQIAKLNSVKTELSNTKIELEDAIAERDTANAERDELKSAMSAKEAELTGYIEQSKTLQSQMAKQKVELDSAKASIVNLNDTISGNEAKITELSEKNTELTTQVKTAQAENTTLTGKISDSENSARLAMSKVASLEEQLKSSKANAEAITEDLKSANTAISQLTDDKTSLESKLVRLQAQSDGYQTKYEKATNELNVRGAELKSAQDMVRVHEETIDSLNTELDTQAVNIVQLKGTIDTLKEQQSDLQSQLQTAEGTISSLRDSISKISDDSDEKSSELNTALQNATDEISTLKANLKASNDALLVANNCIAEAESKYANLTTERNKMITECCALKKEIETLKKKADILSEGRASKDSEIESYKEELHGLQLKLNSAKESVTKLRSEKEQLNVDLESSRTRIFDLETANAELRNASSNTSSDIITLTEKIESKDSEISRLNGEVRKLTDSSKTLENNLESKTRECNSLRGEIDELKSQLASASASSTTDTAEIQQLRERITQLETRLATKETLLKTRESELAFVNSSLKKANSEIELLHTSAEATEDKDSQLAQKDELIKDLKKSLSESDEKIANLQEEVVQKESVITKMSEDKADTSEADALRARVSELEASVAKAKTDSTEVINALKGKLSMANDDLTKTRKELSKTETILVSKNDEISALRNSVFTAMSTTTLPKSVMNLSLAMPMTPFQNVYVFACGSNESSTALYKLLRKQVELRGNIRHLIVDLTMDSSIDRELGLKSSGKILDFLQGNSPVANSVSETKYANCTAMTTAMSYINDLYLLTVDWGKRIQELSSSADIVIINLGSLGDIVRSIIYNSLVSVMRGIIVVKATPINMRTALLKLTGFQTLENTVVVCTDYTEKASKMMYDKLQAKFITRILADTEALSL